VGEKRKQRTSVSAACGTAVDLGLARLGHLKKHVRAGLDRSPVPRPFFNEASVHFTDMAGDADDEILCQISVWLQGKSVDSVRPVTAACGSLDPPMSPQGSS